MLPANMHDGVFVLHLGADGGPPGQMQTGSSISSALREDAFPGGSGKSVYLLNT
jgi:hypothetical protein